MVHHDNRSWVVGAVAAAIAALVLGSCAGDSSDEAGGEAPTSTTTIAIDGVPDDARVAVGEGQPRSAGYWERWSTCGPDSRADVAAANGGAEAGWFLVDDLLVDPGVSLGDSLIETCVDAVAILADRGKNDVDDVAAELFAAQLSRAAGAATCDVSEQALVAAHTVLSARGYSGWNSVESQLDEAERAVLTLVRQYNAGQLCV